MKKLFSFLFFFAVINVAFAQSKPTQKQFITLGGIESGRTVSIMQIMDYPVLLPSAKDEKVESFTLVVSANKEVAEYKIIGAKLSQEAIAYLKRLNGRNGTIAVKNILLSKESIKIEEKDLEYFFEQ